MTYSGSQNRIVNVEAENMKGCFVKIGLPNIEKLRATYGHMLMLSAMKSIEGVAKAHLGDVTVIWLHKAAAIQVHKASETLDDAMRNLYSFYDAISQGLTLSLDGKAVELHWASEPLMAVIDQGSDRSISQRFIRTGDMLHALETLGGKEARHGNRRVIMDSEFKSPSEIIQGQVSDWRRQETFHDALTNNGIGLGFKEIRSTVTNSLNGFSASINPIPLDAKEGQTPAITDLQMWMLAEHVGATDDLTVTLIRLALNQLRVWSVLISNNDATITISVPADSITENQERIYQLLKRYRDVSHRLITALKLSDKTFSLKNRPLLIATVTDLTESTGTQFALAEMGLTHGKLEIVQKLSVVATYLPPHWADGARFYENGQPVVANLTNALHKFRSEVIASNINPQKTPLSSLMKLGIDSYVVANHPPAAATMTADQAIIAIKNQEDSISKTVIDSRLRFQQAI